MLYMVLDLIHPIYTAFHYLCTDRRSTMPGVFSHDDLCNEYSATSDSMLSYEMHYTSLSISITPPGIYLIYQIHDMWHFSRG